MIPDLEFMIAAYTLARLIRSAVGPKKESSGKQALYLPTAVDIVAIVIISICATLAFLQSTAPAPKL